MRDMKYMTFRETATIFDACNSLHDAARIREAKRPNADTDSAKYTSSGGSPGKGGSGWGVQKTNMLVL